MTKLQSKSSRMTAVASSLRRYRTLLILSAPIVWLSLIVAAVLTYASAPLVSGLLIGAASGAMLLAIVANVWLQRRAFRRAYLRDMSARKTQEKLLTEIRSLRNAIKAHQMETRKGQQANRGHLAELDERVTQIMSEVSTRFDELSGAQERTATRLVLRADQLTHELEIAQNLALAKQREMSTSILERLLSTSDELSRLEHTIRQERRHAYVDIESLASIHRSLEIRHPLPPLGDWAINPDAALYVINLIAQTRPKDIVEIGSGASTVLFGYAAQAAGARVLSLEHDESFAAKTRAMIKTHGLENCARVVTAPLVSVELAGAEYRWYDMSAVDMPESADIVFVDGPPTKTGPLARYPAVPQMWEYLGPNSTVILDDARRPDEQEAIRRWLSEYPLVQEYIQHERGTAVLRPTL